ncbi:hypothetical protein OCU04_002336 [Sclerotinia nivalis]|uniref:Uncharacterized protein n=1 Tax=Sclerotinia nivalis TaxID=352851 RepID=A0A9X0ATE3_9HELO|nr:hypothetical protein OCU04_002336 [Sclerotinia nivalis]
MAAIPSINREDTKMTILLERILKELKALRHDKCGVTVKESPGPPNKTIPKNDSFQQDPSSSSIRSSTAITAILKIYENDEVSCRDGDQVVENLPQRTASVEEQDKWNAIIGSAWNVPEDGRFKLTFSKRSLLSVDPKTAVEHLQGMIREDTEISKWFTGGKTRIMDVFDDQTTKVYTFNPQTAKGSNVSSAARHRIDYINASQVSSLPGSSTTVWSGPWRRMISIWAPETRDRCVIDDVGSNPLPKSQGSPSPGTGAEDNYLFDVTFYEIVSVLAERAPSIPWNYWKHGKLHSDRSEDFTNTKSRSKPRVRKLLESRYHLQAFATPEPGCNTQYWTLLELNPATFTIKRSTQSLRILSGNMLLCVFAHACTAVSSIVSRWKKILEFFDQSIGDKLAFLDPDYHDKLLSDDEVLSRSKKYFWVISTLKELHTSILKNIVQIDALVHRRTNESSTKEELDGIKRFRGAIQKELQELKDIAFKLEKKKEEATYLRDGLISASSLVETRNSTRFNQNIKLLTYVSIFFLPLSFCMSVWSINGSFGFRNLAIVASVLATATYLIVLNVDRLMYAISEVYHKFIRNSLEAMKNDRSIKWANRALELEKYSEPPEGTQKPSDWIYLLYTIRRLFQIPVIDFRRKIGLSCKLLWMA